MNHPGTRTLHASTSAAPYPQAPVSGLHCPIPLTRYLDSSGHAVASLPAFARDPATLVPLYEAMLKTRAFDKRAVSLQRTGQLGTYASSLGQEAIGAAIGLAMADEDVLVPAYREYAAQFMRGVAMSEILLYWGGNEQGMNFEQVRSDFPICVPIASQAPQAAGVAYAIRLRRQKRAVVCVLGDGATSKGDFYEALNAAGVWKLPLVFVINNNRWAISLRREKQSATQSLAQKACAAGVPGEQVDGNDVIAMLERMRNALQRARNGGGATLIEALSYRLCDHTTADDAGRYRTDAEVEQAWQHEPLSRLKNFMTGSGLWNESRDNELLEAAAQAVESAVKTYLNTPPQPPESMFDYLYATVPAALVSQRTRVLNAGGRDA